jgi:REP element-mobilizing transposase RayT
MWNDTDTPLAYLITFRCYGTWLHGDRRGSADRHNNSYGLPMYEVNEHWQSITSARLKHDPVKLNADSRRVVEEAIRETSRLRSWELYALNVRTNHAHSVLSTGGKKPEFALTAFKANATRLLREAGLWPFEHSPWSEGGSKRKLWNEQSVSAAIGYVLYDQGDILPEFDR